MNVEERISLREQVLKERYYRDAPQIAARLARELPLVEEPATITLDPALHAHVFDAIRELSIVGGRAVSGIVIRLL